MDNDTIIETYLRDWCYTEVEEALNVARADEKEKMINERNYIVVRQLKDLLHECNKYNDVSIRYRNLCLGLHELIALLGGIDK